MRKAELRTSAHDCACTALLRLDECVGSNSMKYIPVILLSMCPLLAQTSGVAGVESSVGIAPFISPAYVSHGDRSEKVQGRRLYYWSIAALAAGNAADATSSWRRPEANPVLANPGATFGTQSLLLKSGLFGASLLLEHWALHHNLRLYKPFAWMNFAVGGGLGAVAARNASLP